MHSRQSAVCRLFLILCTISLVLSLKKNGHTANVASLRDAVNNAFDALTEVQMAIPKYDTVFEEESVNLGDIGMNKETAEKFIEEIDQLEDILMNKENLVADTKRKQKSEENDKKDVILAEKRSKSFHVKEIDGSRKDDDKNVDKSFDLILDILKKGIGEKSRDTKFQDYVMSNFEKETRGMKIKKELDEITKKEKANKDNEKITTQTKKSKTSPVKKEVKKCVGTKKECVSKNLVDKKEIEVTKKAETRKRVVNKKAVKSSSLKKKDIKSNAKANKRNLDHLFQVKDKTTSKKQSSADVDYDIEIKSLVDDFLRKREEAKREKLKVALADLFQILNKKRSNMHS